MALPEAKGRAADMRPLSPHLQVYSRLINMVMSILHRITGAALYFGTLLLAAWLFAAASGRFYFDEMSALMRSPIGLVVMLGYTWALVHHALGGIRHLIWDTGRGFALGAVNFMSWMTILTSLLVTGGIWFAVLTLKGGF